MFRKMIVAGLIMASAAGSVALAHGGSHRGGAKMNRALQQLDLSDAQKQQIRTLMENERDANQGLREQTRAKAREYRELREANDPRADSVKVELDALRDQFKARHEAVRAEINKLLTADQRQKLEEWKANHPKRDKRNRD